MFKIQQAEIVSIDRFFSGKRALLDFMTRFGPNDYVFVGNTMYGFFAIPSENHNSKDYLPRAFRFNVGAINQYICANESVKYIDELRPGDMVTICRNGIIEECAIARVKIEERKFCRVVAKFDSNKLNVILQDGETSALLSNNKLVNLSGLKVGNQIDVVIYGKSTHLGKEIEENCVEL